MDERLLKGYLISLLLTRGPVVPIISQCDNRLGRIQFAHPSYEYFLIPVLTGNRTDIFACGPMLIVSHQYQVVSRGSIILVVPVRVIKGHRLHDEQTLYRKCCEQFLHEGEQVCLS